MTITSYDELQDAVGNFLQRASEFGSSGSAATRTEEWITLAEHQIANDADLRIRAMETSTDLTVDAQEVSLPTRYIGARRIYLSGDPVRKLEYMTPDNFWVKWMSSQTSKPKAFTIEGENIVFGPAPDDTYTGKFLFYQRFQALSDSNTSNWLITNAADLLFYATLIHGGAYIRDSEVIAFASAMYDDAKERIPKADSFDRHSGAVLAATPDFLGL